MVATTFQPWWWKNFAVALPIPLELPVMRMVLFMCFSGCRSAAGRWLGCNARTGNGRWH
jgi:hypothetical protein